MAIKKLTEVIKRYKDTPFEWGETDCCMFVADCAIATRGIDIAERHRGRYSTEIGAARAQVKYGTIEQTLDSYFPVTTDNLKQRGDICTHILEDGSLSVAVWFSGWYCMSENGCIRSDIKPIKIWAVTHG
jgi:hypothetical protein